VTPEAKTGRRRWWLALRLGVIITAIPFFAFTIADIFSPRVDLPVLQRGRYVWLWYWPTVFWSHGDNPTNIDDIATFAINVATYSLICYVALMWKERHAPISR
jgi:hypothetical protein